MSQQGIFRIASGGPGGVPSPENNGDSTSPFRVVDEQSATSSANHGDVQTDRPVSRHSEEVRGEPFQINGFPERNGDEIMEAAPVAPIQDANAPMVGNDPYDYGAYEAAKASLEPQQDFAAIPARINAALSSVPEEFTSQSARDRAEPARNYQEQNYQEQNYQEQKPQPTSRAQPSVTQRADRGAHSEIQQLELRAIFGVDHMLDTEEILQRARIMPGIRNVVIVEDREAEAISNFRLAMERMGFGDSDQMKLNSGGGAVDFITEGNTTLATLVEGSYAPGVKETLIIVAREIGKLA